MTNKNKKLKRLKSIFLSVFDQLDLVTYEEVVKLDYFKRKTLVLLGKFQYPNITVNHLFPLIPV